MNCHKIENSANGFFALKFIEFHYCEIFYVHATVSGLILPISPPKLHPKNSPFASLTRGSHALQKSGKIPTAKINAFNKPRRLGPNSRRARDPVAHTHLADLWITFRIHRKNVQDKYLLIFRPLFQ